MCRQSPPAAQLASATAGLRGALDDSYGRDCWVAVEVNLLMAALDHPARVTRIDDASIEIYVLPLLLGYAFHHAGCAGRSADEMLNITGSALFNSPQFQRRNGRDHFATAFDWRTVDKNYEGPMKQVMDYIVLGTMETVSPKPYGSCRVVLPYNAHFNVYHRGFDHTRSVPKFTVFFMGQATPTHRGYKDRYAGVKTVGASNISRAVLISNDDAQTREEFPDECNFDECCKQGCGPCRVHPDLLMYEELLSESRFALIFRGDAPTTSHLYDAIGAGVVPVLVGETIQRVGLPFTGIVSWPDISVSLPADFTIEDLEALQQMSDEVYHRKLRALRHHQKDLLWNYHNSIVFDNAMVQMATYCLG